MKMPRFFSSVGARQGKTNAIWRRGQRNTKTLNNSFLLFSLLGDDGVGEESLSFDSLKWNASYLHRTAFGAKDFLLFSTLEAALRHKRRTETARLMIKCLAC